MLLRTSCSARPNPTDTDRSLPPPPIFLHPTIQPQPLIHSSIQSSPPANPPFVPPLKKPHTCQCSSSSPSTPPQHLLSPLHQPIPTFKSTSIAPNRPPTSSNIPVPYPTTPAKPLLLLRPSRHHEVQVPLLPCSTIASQTISKPCTLPLLIASRRSPLLSPIAPRPFPSTHAINDISLKRSRLTLLSSHPVWVRLYRVESSSAPPDPDLLPLLQPSPHHDRRQCPRLPAPLAVLLSSTAISSPDAGQDMDLDYFI